MCDFPVDGSNPDLIFYYDVSKTVQTTIVNNDQLNNYISQNTLFKEKDEKIPLGNYIFTSITAKDIKLNCITFAFYFDEPQGGFSCQLIGRPGSNPGRIDPNTYVIYDIICGNGNYLNAKGFVYVKSNNTPIREVYVYFTKCIK